MRTFEELIRERLPGASDPGDDSTTVFKSIAIGLLFLPKTALYFSILAKNGLSQALQREIDLLDDLASAVQDLGNPVYDVGGTESLTLAKSALIHLEQLPRVDSSSQAFVTYQRATDEFLTRELAPSTAGQNGNDLLRSSDEALEDVRASLASMRDVHAEVLDRLYKLGVGIDNFLAAPLQTLLGNMTIGQVRKDLEDVVAMVAEGTASGIARDIVMKIIAGREILSLISRAPGVYDQLLPENATASSAPAPATVVADVAPMVLSANPVISISVSGETPVAYAFFIGNSAILVSQPVTFPVTVPSGSSLYLTLNSLTVEVPLEGTYASVVDLVVAVNSAGVPDLHAAQFALDPTRWLLYSSSSSIVVSPVLHRVQDGVVTVWAQSAHALVGLEMGQEGTDEIQVNDIIDAINNLYPSLVTATVTEDDQVLISTVETKPGTTLAVAMPDFDDAASAVSETLSPDSLLLLENVQVGDMVQFGDETSTIVSKTNLAWTLQDPVSTQNSAPVQATSRLVLSYGELSDVIQPAYSSWTSSPYAQDLTPLDRAVAPLEGNRSESQRNSALGEIEKLRGELDALLQGLLSVDFPSDADPREVALANGIIEMLHERKYDRAADLLLRCDLASLLTMNEDTASYAGEALRTTENFARNAVRLRQLDGEDAPGSESYPVGRG